LAKVAVPFFWHTVDGTIDTKAGERVMRWLQYATLDEGIFGKASVGWSTARSTGMNMPNGQTRCSKRTTALAIVVLGFAAMALREEL
jgi:hypothetical protein